MTNKPCRVGTFFCAHAKIASQVGITMPTVLNVGKVFGNCNANGE